MLTVILRVIKVIVNFPLWGFVFQISLIELNYFYNSNFLKNSECF